MTATLLADLDAATVQVAAALAVGMDADAIAATLADELMDMPRDGLAKAVAQLLVDRAQHFDDDEVERSGTCYKDNRCPAEPGQMVDYPCGRGWDFHGWWEPRTAELPQVTR